MLTVLAMRALQVVSEMAQGTALYQLEREPAEAEALIKTSSHRTHACRSVCICMCLQHKQVVKQP